MSVEVSLMDLCNKKSINFKWCLGSYLSRQQLVSIIFITSLHSSNETVMLYIEQVNVNTSYFLPLTSYNADVAGLDHNSQ